jgi:chromosome segregation ATPase
MNQSNSPIVDALVLMLNSARAQDPDGRQLAIEIAQNMENDQNDRVKGEIAVLQCNLDNKNSMVTALTEENQMLRERFSDSHIERKEGTIAAITEENRMLRENNCMLRGTVAAKEKEIKRLQEDLQVYRSACASEKQFVGEAARAAKRPRSDSSDGSGANP